jgi:hypothetical protein
MFFGSNIETLNPEAEGMPIVLRPDQRNAGFPKALPEIKKANQLIRFFYF